ncbi:MAG: zf-HC2 domain-containing protein [Bacteroidales bacterium]|nr:zf-HC2 domain-containing protein [Bacteroidales bacterium]
MNCQLCQKKLDAYREGILSDDMRTQVKAHLKLCAECGESYRIQLLADSVVNDEKMIIPDNDLTSRIMARLDNSTETGYRNISPFRKVLKPALIITSLAAAIFAGVLIGNIYKPSVRELSQPLELALIDDVAIESVDILSNQ